MVAFHKNGFLKGSVAKMKEGIDLRFHFSRTHPLKGGTS